MKRNIHTTTSRDALLARRRQIVSSLSNKEYRDAFVRQSVETGLPFQIQGMRAASNKSQKELGELLGKPQSVVSRLESPGYGRFNLNTLLEVASVFDVALLVSFVPFSELADRASQLTSSSLQVPEFSKDVMLDPQYGLAASNVSYMFSGVVAGNANPTPIYGAHGPVFVLETPGEIDPEEPTNGDVKYPVSAEGVRNAI